MATSFRWEKETSQYGYCPGNRLTTAVHSESTTKNIITIDVDLSLKIFFYILRPLGWAILAYHRHRWKKSKVRISSSKPVEIVMFGGDFKLWKFRVNWEEKIFLWKFSKSSEDSFAYRKNAKSICFVKIF